MRRSVRVLNSFYWLRLAPGWPLNLVSLMDVSLRGALPKLGMGGPTLTQILYIPLPLAHPPIPYCIILRSSRVLYQNLDGIYESVLLAPPFRPLYPIPRTHAHHCISLVTVRLSITGRDLCCDVVLCIKARYAFQPSTLPKRRTQNPIQHSFVRSRWCVRSLLSRPPQYDVFASCLSHVCAICLGPQFCGCSV